MFFEGVEKKILVKVSDKHISLRQFDADFWAYLVSFSRAKILSKISSTQCDAYLLSESSLFVWDKAFLMLTCGDSTLVDSLIHFMSQVHKDAVVQVRYCRRNEFMPALQQQHFLDDISLLKQKINGRAYRIGHLDGHHQYVFHADLAVLNPVEKSHDKINSGEIKRDEISRNEKNTGEMSYDAVIYDEESCDGMALNEMVWNEVSCDGIALDEMACNEVNRVELKPFSAGCELLMYHIQGEFATYLRSDSVSCEGIRERLGLERFFPQFILDDHCFSPYGYSINGMYDANYFTIHITPQTQSSYVSVETNFGGHDQYSALVEHFLSLFLPKKWDVQTLNRPLVLPSNQRVLCLLESQLSLSNTEKLFFYQYQLNHTEVLPAYGL
ncbi:hypothetical protein [uncultured Shewanella sp.]|uniref:hypothetical protein n=1 Tax=uncultured Shewanella sp. TaxID=173975 RepID=UPI00260CB2C4|nr:hypothetical protein [uncultured Shewanella sp.]